MKVLVTGADGFIGKNLVVRLRESRDIEVLPFTRTNAESDLGRLLEEADVVFHLAGVNRPQNVAEFDSGNTQLTHRLASLIEQHGRRTPVVFASSMQVKMDNAYGKSKQAAEDALLAYARSRGAPVYVYRLPNVFGKWCRPNYNSAVATFCHNIARGLPITVNDPAATVSLVYIDDVVEEFNLVLRHHLESDHGALPGPLRQVAPSYSISVGHLAETIRSFRDSRTSLSTDRVGAGLLRALYATYVSYLPADLFSYPLSKHVDQRGEFAEILRTPDSGQISYFTAHPGVTRGGHYHHSKTEKFLVVRGRARFRFCHILSGETAAIETSEEEPRIVETAPGWAHDITNIGETEMIVMLWANEVFDPARPDTFKFGLRDE